MTMLPGRQKPVWPRACWIAALAWSALWSSAAGIVVPPARIACLRGAGAEIRRRACRGAFLSVPTLKDWGWRKGKPVAGLAAAQGGGTAGSARSRAMAALVLRRLPRFAEIRGVPAGREFLLDYDVIEAFCVTGLRGRACSARGTYRSALYRLAEVVHGPAGQRATLFAGARAPAPYSPARALLRRAG